MTPAPPGYAVIWRYHVRPDMVEGTFASFRERCGQPYRELDSSCDELTRQETRVGSFTELG